MKFICFLCGLTFSTLCMAADPQSGAPTPLPQRTQMFGQAGDFDTWIFEMSDQREFCVGQPSNPSCVHPDPNHRMGLHGLWPNRKDDTKHQYSFCGLTANPIPNAPHSWCLPQIDVKGQLSSGVFSLLNEVMPSADQSCLYNHEWYVHGTCSGLNPNDYFLADATIASNFQNLKFLEDFLDDSAGYLVDRSKILDAIALDIGDESMKSIKLSCFTDKKTGKTSFSAVDVSLDRNNFIAFPEPKSMASFAPAGIGNCPESGIYITP